MIRTGIGTKRPLSIDEKRLLFREGRYVFKAPPVCSAAWSEEDWIRYIKVWDPKPPGRSKLLGYWWILKDGGLYHRSGEFDARL